MSSLSRGRNRRAAGGKHVKRKAMPGIFGLISDKPVQETRAIIASMASVMSYEPSYTLGTYQAESLGIYIGWAILAGSFSDGMPLWNEQKDICLFLSGEVFTDSEELARSKRARHTLNPAEAGHLVDLYEEHGCEFFSRLNGSFAGLLLDTRQGKAFLFNDRYGLERIYFHENGSDFYYSSEAKALLKVLPATRRLDERSFAEFLSLNCVLQNRTLFAGISLVPGGSVWAFSGKRVCKKHFYFSREAWESQPELTKEVYREKFRETWKRILPRYVRGHEKVALSLTGGIDSRMILAWLQPGAGALPCYTWDSMYHSCFDARLAHKIAKICQQPHHTIPLRQSFFAEFPKWAEKAVYVSDGCKNVTGAIDLYLQRSARSISPVRLTGVYGNELLRRKITFTPHVPRETLYEHDALRLVEAAHDSYRAEVQGNLASFALFKQAPWHASGNFSIQRAQLTFRTPYFDNDLVALAYQAPQQCQSVEFFLNFIAEGNPALADLYTDRGFARPPASIRKKFTRSWREFTFKAEYLFNDGMPQWFARINKRASLLHLERLFLGRHKVDHFRTWYQNELADYVKGILLDPKTLSRSYLNRRRLEVLVSDHLSGRANYTGEITRVLTLELLLRSLIEHA